MVGTHFHMAKNSDRMRVYNKSKFPLFPYISIHLSTYMMILKRFLFRQCLLHLGKKQAQNQDHANICQQDRVNTTNN